MQFIIGRYAEEKDTVYTGCGTLRGFRHPPGVLGHIPVGKGGVSVVSSGR